MNESNFKVRDVIDNSRRLSQLLNENDFKLFLKNNGLVPFLKDGRIVVYKIKVTEDLGRVIMDFEDYFFDVYESVLPKKIVFNNDLCNSSIVPFFRNMLGFRNCKDTDFFKEFNLNSEFGVKDFLNRYSQDSSFSVFNDIYLQQNAVKRECLSGIVSRMIDDYVTCFFKKTSKVVEFLSFINSSNYIDFDYCVFFIYAFFYGAKNGFGVNCNSDFDYLNFDEINFSDKEFFLDESDKIAVIRKILGSFDIECVYNVELDKLSCKSLNEKFDGYFDIISEKVILDFAIHNSIILFSSDFTELYKKIVSFGFTKKIK